jgi:hypothetical protein
MAAPITIVIVKLSVRQYYIKREKHLIYFAASIA